MSAVLTQPMTADDFWRLPEAEKRLELVRGRVVEHMLTGALHGAVTVEFAGLLYKWARGGAGGYVGVSAGFILARDPDTVRRPDISYIYPARISATGIPEGFYEGAPDLAVEIVSASETADEVREKVRDYLAAGTSLVLTIYLRTREVIAHTFDGLARTFGPDATLEFPPVLPGFSCRVVELFA